MSAAGNPHPVGDDVGAFGNGDRERTREDANKARLRFGDGAGKGSREAIV